MSIEPYIYIYMLAGHDAFDQTAPLVYGPFLCFVYLLAYEWQQLLLYIPGLHVQKKALRTKLHSPLLKHGFGLHGEVTRKLNSTMMIIHK